jgi:hypothetical protein
MNNHMQDGMAEATRLMREGRLVEATAIIQRTLGEGHLGSTSEQATTTDATGRPFEAFYRILDEALSRRLSLASRAKSSSSMARLGASVHSRHVGRWGYGRHHGDDLS